tara:strand:+ start:1652 stop:2002 length:351 start_codon:yes stop_codon:yes gene_type:complete
MGPEEWHSKNTKGGVLRDLELESKDDSGVKSLLTSTAPLRRKTPTALDIQIGGDHYKKYKIQPMEYSMANKLDAAQHTAIKYVTRCYDKGSTLLDLDKAIHTIELMKEFYTNDQPK